MRSPLVLVAAVVSLALVVSAAAQTGARKQIVDNGGFEQGVEGWQPNPNHVLTTDADASHSGNNCLFGEVTGDRQALILERELQLDPNKLYEFEIWARATNKTKLVLWRRTAGNRTMVDAWQNLPQKWGRYSAPLSVETAGPTVLEIVAPSSHGAPPGKIWVDDIKVFAYDLPFANRVSDEQGFDDEPAMACGPDGTAWFAWTSFREGDDTLQCGRGLVSGEKIAVSDRWPVPLGPNASVLAPSLTAADGAAWLVYSAEQAGNWDIYACRVDQNGPARAIRVTRSPSADLKPTCAVDGDSLWIAWESNRDDGWHQTYMARLEGQRISEPQRLSAPGRNNYAPSIALVAPGKPYVAWYCFRENNFDIYAYDSNAPAPEEKRLTTAATVDRDPRVISSPDGLWMAWSNANSGTYHVGSARDKRIQVAKITPSGLQSPPGTDKTALWRNSELADVAIDSQGRLWVSGRTGRGRAGWDVILLCYSGNKWSETLRIAPRKGMCRRAQLGVTQGRVLIGYQGDTVPVSWDDVDSTAAAESIIYAASLDPASAPAPAALALEPYKEPEDPFEAAQIRLARGEDAGRRSITYGGRQLNLYFGDLHEHTDISVCNRTGDQTQDQSYQSMRDITRHDFAALTDHGYNFNDYLWAWTAKMARSNNDDGRFLTFLAEEWTSTFEKYDEKHPYGYYGHRNLIFEDDRYPQWFNARDGKNPAEVWEILRKGRVNFIHIPHQLADTGNVPTDWNYVDEQAQPVAEIFQTRGSYEYDGAPRQAKNATPKGWYLQDAWANGIVIGVIASPDHGGGYGKAAVYAPDLSRKSILEAIRARHTYGTTAAKMFLDVRVNGHLMGEKAPAAGGKPVRIEMRASCPGDIERIEVCRNNQFIYSPQVVGKECDITFVDNAPPDGPCYYYVRVIQQDQEIAWSSPVWLGDAGPI